MLEEFDWYRLANGDVRHPMRVGELSLELCRYAGCEDRRVMLDPGYSPKLRFKHRLDHIHFGMIPWTLERGAVLQDRPGDLVFVYDDTMVFQASFYLIVKTMGERHELWVRSFRRIRESDKRRLFRRNQIIRPHK